MGSATASLSSDQMDWLGRQPMFFVATAPHHGHVNLSPKGLDTFAVIDDTTVCYLDLTGSGVETIAHLRQNGRITLLFCAFEGPPRIVRIFGTGRPVTPDDPAFGSLAERFPDYPGARSVIVVDVERVGSSCGFAVPLMTFEGQRERLLDWATARRDGLADYWSSKNAVSIDGLPGLPTPPV